MVRMISYCFYILEISVISVISAIPTEIESKTALPKGDHVLVSCFFLRSRDIRYIRYIRHIHQN